MSAFYDLHATAFSKSRFRIWPHVKDFINSLPANSTVLDLGCGNGKNMSIRPSDITMFGLEQSQPLCDICTSRNLNVIQGDARSIPFKDQLFDAVIMIAVIHHINPAEHYKVLDEISRILKPGGRALITNWAVEQPEGAKRSFHAGLNWVVWKEKDNEPLPYWIMDIRLAGEFCEDLAKHPHLMCEKFDWDAGNWEFWLEKL